MPVSFKERIVCGPVPHSVKRITLIGCIVADESVIISDKPFDHEIWLQRFA
jgi:hypothetical protein